MMPAGIEGRACHAFSSAERLLQLQGLYVPFFVNALNALNARMYNL